MNAPALIDETTRYPEAIDVFRSLELDIQRRSEADEIDALTTVRAIPLEPKCDRCASPRMRINGRHVCLGVD